MNIYARAHTADWLYPIGYPEQKGPKDSAHNWKLGLDATAWFMQATDDQILQLAREGLGDGTISEQIIDFLLDPANGAPDPRLIELNAHAAYMQPKKIVLQRELYVDPTQILPWLGIHRPHLVDPVLKILDSN